MFMRDVTPFIADHSLYRVNKVRYVDGDRLLYLAHREPVHYVEWAKVPNWAILGASA